MAKKDKQQRSVKVEEAPKPRMFEKLESWFLKNDKKVFYVLLFLSTLFSLLMFDSKVSPGGDDSSYIERAWSLVHEGKYPYFQGPGYPVFLSVFVRMFGLNVIALKFFSVLCQIGFVWFTYKAFRNRIPYTVLFALISFISFNHFIQYYSSQTFTETFFLFLQAICLYVTFMIIDSIRKEDTWMEALKKNYLKWLMFGFVFLLLTISKSIAFVCIIAVIMYFLITRNYKQAVFAVLSFVLIRMLYSVIVTGMYGASDSDQLELMLRKEMYKPAAGHEDFAGLVKRFFDNFNTYISLHMYRIMHLRNAENEFSKIIPALSYISTIILGIVTVVSFKRNKYVFLSAIYFAILCSGIFVGIQAANMQDRLIIIAMPLIFLVLYFGAYELAKKSSAAQNVFVIFSAFMLLVTIGKSVVISKENTTALKKNLSGDIYYGYTPDWENYLKMSKFCADSLPADAQVLSRKPNMSFIYADGKKFVGQYLVTTTNPDSVLMTWQKANVKYILLPSLRMNPKKNNGMIINTIHRMLAPVYQKYPQKIKLVKSMGKTEKCDLYELDYNAKGSSSGR